ncbi:MAG: hypothetical protein ACP5HU_05335 [Phycisphaerae bacterium]
MHTFKCPHCGTEFEFPDEQAGGVVTCLGCGRGVVLPARPSAVQHGAGDVRKRPGFWVRFTGWVGWMAVGLVLVATGLVWVAIFGRGEAPTVPLALMMAGFLLILLWFLGHYVVAAFAGEGD